MTLADVLQKIKEGLDWRGPSDRTLGHIVLTREEAAYLHEHVIQLIIERDELVYRKEQLERSLEAVVLGSTGEWDATV